MTEEKLSDKKIEFPEWLLGNKPIAYKEGFYLEDVRQAVLKLQLFLDKYAISSYDIARIKLEINKIFGTQLSEPMEEKYG